MSGSVIPGFISEGAVCARSITCNTIKSYGAVTSSQAVASGSTALVAAGDALYTIPSAAALLSTRVYTFAASANRVFTLPSTASIIAALGGAVGSTITFSVVNTGASTVTLTAASGTTTIVGVAALAATSAAQVFVTIASATTVVAGFA